MPGEQPSLPATWRDGTSQAGRVLPELDPDYARVDERTSADLLAFAAKYARELKYFPLDDPDRPQDDWRGFIGDTASPRPHFALFLAFLELLGAARAQLNTLTRRHLEFFYRDVLKMFGKRAVADQVHVLAELESGTSEALLPAGTALSAGKDSLGRELVYRTGRALVANRVEVAEIRSLHAEIKFTGLREASRESMVNGTRNDAFLSMMKIALGQPNPGDPLPDLGSTPPAWPGVPPAGPPAKVGFAALVEAQKLVGVVEAGLGMPLFDDLRELMRLKGLRDKNETEDWKTIDSYLVKAGKARDPNFVFNPQTPRNFQEDLRAVLNKTPAEFARLYDGLPEVKSIDEVYDTYLKRPDVQDFIRAKLYLSLEDFAAMMQKKTAMDSQWSLINRLLEEAGKVKSKNPEFVLAEPARASRVFAQKLAAAGLDFKYPPDYQFAGPLDASTLDAFYQAFLAVERYFFMPAENFKFIMSVATQGAAPAEDEWNWQQVYDIAAAAHREMIYARRRAVLLRAAQPYPQTPIADPVKALGDMLVIALALEEPVKPEELAQKLGQLKATPADLKYLGDIAEERNTQPDWARVVSVLEIAQRNLENFKDPVPAKVEWRNLYPAADAKKVVPPSAQPAGPGPARWKTFGLGEQPREKEPAPQPLFGWALASPLLALSEGARTVTLTLGFSADPQSFDRARIRELLAPPASMPNNVAGFNPFKVEVSTAKGWLEPDTVKLSWGVANNPASWASMDGSPLAVADPSKLRALIFSFTLAKGQPALAPLTRAVHGIDTPVPVLRLMMKPVWNETDKCYVTSYQALQNLLLMRARLVVGAAGLEGLALRNDQSVLDPKKPFEPFGLAPAVGSRLYLGHREIVGKKLSALTFNITWMGVPSGLGDYYRNYPGGLANASFKAKASLSEAGALRDFGAPFQLFDANDPTRPFAVSPALPPDQGNPDNAGAGAADVTQWNRYLVWELQSPDFQHAAYPAVALQKSLELAAAVSNAPSYSTSTTPPGSTTAVPTITRQTVNAVAYQVNPPYTPKIKSLTLDYTAAAELVLDPAAGAASALRVFHVQPFGYAELAADPVLPGRPFLPQYDFEGELYIGLRNVAAPQNVSLLFQVAEGSANPDAAPEPLQWSYLSGNRWLTLHDGSLLAEGTRGLINSGIVELALKPAQPSTLLPGDLYWIRVAIARSADCVCDMVAVHPNATLATFADQGNAADHLSAPLPPERIGAPVAPVPGIARMRQPYTSFGGKMAEQDSSFYVRVSERLRHKQRALTVWDYEHLVLEKFPDLYKVKCLPADPAAHPRDPGRIELVVIPDIRNRLPFNPFEPKAPNDALRDIEEFMQDKVPPFVSVKAKNAHYVPVKVRCGVRFVEGADEGYCRRRLNDELNRFLSPWAYEEGADIVIGGAVYANSIINFIDGRDYVDYIAEFKLFASDDGGEKFNFVPIPETGGYHVRPKGPDAVLVAWREHQFDVISQADYRIQGFSGVDYMRIELDFIVS